MFLKVKKNFRFFFFFLMGAYIFIIKKSTSPYGDGVFLRFSKNLKFRGKSRHLEMYVPIKNTKKIENKIWRSKTFFYSFKMIFKKKKKKLNFFFFIFFIKDFGPRTGTGSSPYGDMPRGSGRLRLSYAFTH